MRWLGAAAMGWNADPAPFGEVMRPPQQHAKANRGSSLALARNEDYWGKHAALAGAEFRFIADAQAMNNALKAGDIDAIGQVGGPEQLAAFQQVAPFTIVKGAPTGKLMCSLTGCVGTLASRSSSVIQWNTTSSSFVCRAETDAHRSDPPRAPRPDRHHPVCGGIR
jgi:Bacterial extracellular solute-binding proteins, family 5 Middle